MKEEQPSELQVRAWRDIVYDQISTDANWDYCRDRWMQPNQLKWLKEQVKQIKNENNSRKMDGHSANADA